MTGSEKELIAQAATTINAPIAQVWKALVDPELIAQYMFGTTVVTDWEKGSAIVWRGEWQGQAYEDKGTILRIDREQVLQYSHFSPLSGEPDTPDNYHTVTIELSSEGQQTKVTLTQDNNESEEARQHAENNWHMMLEGLKEVVESS